MSVTSVPLTTAGGGINRLRLKGAAQSKSLYMLKNGYVTMAQTIKVRPGTFRNVDLSESSGAAGLTKGLVFYKDKFHVFASQECDVPDGYLLHVLNHPAATKLVTNNFNVNLGLRPVVGPLFVQPGANNSINGAGFSALLSAPHNGGSMAPPGTVGGETVKVLMSGPFSTDLYLTITGTHDATWATTLTYPKAGGGTDTVNFSDAFVTTNDSNPYENTDLANNPTTTYYWPFPPSNPAINNTGVQQTINITKTGDTGTVVPVPLKEIHFAAPYMGFLYVSAEFDTTDAPEAAALGDTFHYWIQTSGVWEADTVYLAGQIVSPSVPNGFQYVATRISAPNPGWTPNTKVIAGSAPSVVEPTEPNGYYFTAIETDGANPLTGTLEPTWPTVTGATVTELSESANNDVVAAPAPQPPTNVPSPGTGGKYQNPYSGPGGTPVTQ